MASGGERKSCGVEELLLRFGRGCRLRVVYHAMPAAATSSPATFFTGITCNRARVSPTPQPRCTAT